MSDAPISARPQVFYVRPAPGWLDLVHEELKTILMSPLEKSKFEPKVTLLKGTVKLHRCDWRQGLEVMLRLTTAHDVEWMVLESKCTKWSEVDAILTRVPWDEILPSREVLVHVTPTFPKVLPPTLRSCAKTFVKFPDLSTFPRGGSLDLKLS